MKISPSPFVVVVAWPSEDSLLDESQNSYSTIEIYTEKSSTTQSFFFIIIRITLMNELFFVVSSSCSYELSLFSDPPVTFENE